MRSADRPRQVLRPYCPSPAGARPDLAAGHVTERPTTNQQRGVRRGSTPGRRVSRTARHHSPSRIGGGGGAELNKSPHQNVARQTHFHKVHSITSTSQAHQHISSNTFDKITNVVRTLRASAHSHRVCLPLGRSTAICSHPSVVRPPNACSALSAPTSLQNATASGLG